MGRLKGDHEKKRQEVVDATIRAIARHGLPNTTVKDIAAEMGVSIGVLSHYFHNKKEVLEFTRAHLFDDMKEKFQTTGNDLRGVARLEAKMLEFLPTNKDRLILWQVYLSFLSYAIGSQKTTKEQTRRNLYSIDLIEEEVKVFQDQGGHLPFSDTRTAAIAIASVAEGLGFHAAVSPDYFKPDLIKKTFAEYLTSLAVK